jgi:hypothetical protein
VLAEKALELAALALVLRGMDLARGLTAAPRRFAPQPAPAPRPAQPPAATRPAAPQPPETFITENAGADGKYYRAHDESGEVLAAFSADGRVRLAGGDHRLAGAVENGRADLLDVANNVWCELFVRVTPDGRTQLELRGGPYDARVFLCEPFEPSVG